MTRKICLIIFKRDSFVKHNKLRLRYKWNTAGCCTGSGFNAAILKISQFPALTKKKKNSHQQQIHHGNQGQAMAVGPFSHHRRKRLFSTYEGYKEVKSTVVNKQVTNELKHMRGPDHYWPWLKSQGTEQTWQKCSFSKKEWDTFVRSWK